MSAQDPDRIDLMYEHELRTELRRVLNVLSVVDSMVDAKQKEIERLVQYIDHKSWCNSRYENAKSNGSITCECDCGLFRRNN